MRGYWFLLGAVNLAFITYTAPYVFASALVALACFYVATRREKT